VLKSQLKREAAVELQAELSDMGALVRIKDLSPDDVRAKYKIDDKVPDRTLKDITAAHVECPRCGHLQLEAQHCARCGVDMKAAIQQKNKEDQLIEKRIKELRGEPAVATSAPRKKRVLVTENRHPRPAATAQAARHDEQKPNPFGKKKGWLSKLRGR
jgi:ribosomal protein L37E